jgi:hypothetical protein
MSETTSRYRAPWLLKHGHSATILTSFFPAPAATWTSGERLELPDGDFLDLAWLQSGQRRLAILSHGLEGSLNDDLQITRIAREHGKRMLFVRGLMAPSPVDYDWSSFLEFARRQYLQVRVYVPLFWWLALGFTSLWLAGFSVTLYEAVQGAAWAWWVLLTVAGCNLLAHRLKNWQLRMLFPPEIWERIRGGRSIGWFTITLNFLLHWAIVASVAFKRDVTWAGIHYRIKGRQRIEVLGRNS